MSEKKKIIIVKDPRSTMEITAQSSTHEVEFVERSKFTAAKRLK